MSPGPQPEIGPQGLDAASLGAPAGAEEAAPDRLHPREVAARVRRWEQDGPQGPLVLEVYPTLVCNLSCRFCDTTLRRKRPEGELSAERLLELVDEAAAMGVARVFVLGGGEPLLRRDVAPALLRRIKAHGMEGVLTTNATLLGAPLARQLVETGWDEVHVSIDGPTPEIHDWLRGQDGAFRTTVRNTCRLSVLKRQLGAALPRVALHFVLTNRNHRSLPDMVRLARALGAFRVDFDALVAYEPEQEALQLSAEQRAEVPGIAAEALALAEELGIATTLAHFLEPERLDRGNIVLPSPGGEGLGAAPCLRAWHYLVVQADGRTSPCCVLAGMGGSVEEASLEEVWRSDPWMEQVRAGMKEGQAQPRCRECSWNILGHETLISSHLSEVGT